MNNEIKEILDELKAIVESKDYENGLVYIEHSYLKAIHYYITNLQEGNERLKEWKEDLLNENIKLENIRKEAIEFIKEKISSTQGVINDYMYHKEHNKILIELLKEDIEMYKKELHILNGGDE